MSNSPVRNRDYLVTHKDVSTAFEITSATTANTTISGSAGFSIVIRRIWLIVSQAAAKTLSFQDSQTTASLVATVNLATTGSTLVYAADMTEGITIAEGYSFVVSASGNGVKGYVAIEAFRKQTSPLSPASASAA